MNPLNMIDFYKADHRRQYPEGTQYVYSNFTPRSSRLSNMPEDFDDKVVFVGLHGYIQRILVESWNRDFFWKDKTLVVQEYKKLMDTSLGVNSIGTDHIEDLHDLGYLPLEIKALPEGSRVNIKVPMFTVRNTLPEFYWLTNYIETSISSEIWKPCTTATIAYEYKKIVKKYAEQTGADLSFLELQCHDFSYRGMSGTEDAASSGIGHLSSFIGTDSVVAIEYAKKYYGVEGNEPIGVSVPATEHSVMCMGTKENEIDTFRRLINELYPAGIVSIVSDTWDFWKVITSYAVTLKQDILDREGASKVVFRPDSGDPVKIICGDNDAEEGTPEHKGAVQCLWEIFGGTQTNKGYKVLNDKVGLIYGDSITLDRAKDMLEGLKAKGFASTNVVLGIGSYTYQYITRDTFGFAMKATWGVVNGEQRNIFKNPVTDSGVKKSAVGLLRVEKEGDDFVLYDNQSIEDSCEGELKTVFFDGIPDRSTSLSTIRRNLKKENDNV